MPKPKAAKPKAAKPDPPPPLPLPAAGATFYRVMSGGFIDATTKLTLQQFIVRTVFKQSVRLAQLRPSYSGPNKFEVLTAQDLHDRGYRATAADAKVAYMTTFVRARMVSTFQHQRAAYQMVEIAQAAEAIQAKLQQLDGQPVDMAAAHAAAIQRGMPSMPDVELTAFAAAAAAGDDAPAGDDGYVRALDALGYSVTDHGNGAFSLVRSKGKGKGGQMVLDADDFSSALAEAWDLVKP